MILTERETDIVKHALRVAAERFADDVRAISTDTLLSSDAHARLIAEFRHYETRTRDLLRKFDATAVIDPGVVALYLKPEQLQLLDEALDSHAYWQLSDEVYRDNGAVNPPGSDDPDNVKALADVRVLQAHLAECRA
ncbi:MAG: hypothetical protein ACRD3G_12175 [Vicinamibacterales bacterium]